MQNGFGSLAYCSCRGPMAESLRHDKWGNQQQAETINWINSCNLATAKLANCGEEKRVANE